MAKKIVCENETDCRQGQLKKEEIDAAKQTMRANRRGGCQGTKERRGKH